VYLKYINSYQGVYFIILIFEMILCLNCYLTLTFKGVRGEGCELYTLCIISEMYTFNIEQFQELKMLIRPFWVLVNKKGIVKVIQDFNIVIHAFDCNSETPI
jgi:hypothetical protein